jgi:hypothetical protein
MYNIDEGYLQIGFKVGSPSLDSTALVDMV